jgi:hypothetical protein
MFKEKESKKGRQINIEDPYHSFPKYVWEALHNSWAELNTSLNISFAASMSSDFLCSTAINTVVPMPLSI